MQVEVYFCSEAKYVSFVNIAVETVQRREGVVTGVASSTDDEEGWEAGNEWGRLFHPVSSHWKSFVFLLLFHTHNK